MKPGMESSCPYLSIGIMILCRKYGENERPRFMFPDSLRNGRSFTTFLQKMIREHKVEAHNGLHADTFAGLDPQSFGPHSFK
jgi:hypothetical protein